VRSICGAIPRQCPRASSWCTLRPGHAERHRRVNGREFTKRDPERRVVLNLGRPVVVFGAPIGRGEIPRGRHVRYRICDAAGRWLAGSRYLEQLRAVVRPGERIYRVTVTERLDNGSDHPPTLALVYGDVATAKPSMPLVTASLSLAINDRPHVGMMP
jgi:hypothetical protein